MIKLIFLGSGSAFTVGDDNFHSNLLLIAENEAKTINKEEKKLLIDCGSDIRFSLHKLGFSYLDITDIFISHLHSDHAGGLEYIGLSSKFDPNCQKPNLYLSHEIAIDIWDKSLSGGMGYIEEVTAKLCDFFHVHSVVKNGCFFWENIKFDLIKTHHVDSGFFSMPSHGLLFQIGNKKIFFTGDTKLCFFSFKDYYEDADIIFHDCEISRSPSPVHAHFNQLIDLPDHIRNKMWLYGYQPGELPDASKYGFCGFVKPGQVFQFSDILDNSVTMANPYQTCINS
jgi:ribonuclease BN (tRNA processing enzyme)